MQRCGGQKKPFMRRIRPRRKGAVVYFDGGLPGRIPRDDAVGFRSRVPSAGISETAGSGQLGYSECVPARSSG